LISRNKLFLGLVIGLLIIIGICLFNALNFESRQIFEKEKKHTKISNQAIERLKTAIGYKTISSENTNLIDSNEFLNFHRFLEGSFPEIHRNLELTKIGNLSLLFRWEGTNTKLKPILLMSHQDVVPIDSTTIEKWELEPFSGGSKNGYIYGRGTLDVKSGILAQMEAVELLLKKGFKPTRTIYLAYGHDEEVGGQKGAKKIAQFLKNQNVKIEFILDEGGSIISDVIPGLQNPVALIGVAEKGYLSLELSVSAKGGHSSMPPKETAIGILSKAISNLENNPLPYTTDGVGSLMFDYLAPEMTFSARLAFGNKWLFNPIIKRKLEQNNGTRATLHTTIAATMIESGTKENVLPTSAKAIVNFRIIPGENSSSVQKYVKQIINDNRVKIKKTTHFQDEPSGISNPESPNFRNIQKSISAIFPKTLVAPYLVLGSTDARHYNLLSKNIYRFVPFRLSKSDLSRMHGLNERISIKNYKESINFYLELLQRTTQK
jgi:carboxypeptidase PM20D1